MNQPVHHVFHPHHWHVHEEIVHPSEDDVVRNPDAHVVNAFRIAAASYLGLTLGALGLLSAGVIPPEAIGGRMLLCAGAGFVAAALLFLAGVLYNVPHALGGGLWSVKLAWSHFAALNAAVLVPVWFLIFRRTLADLAAAEILAMVVILHAGAIAAFIANMFESVTHFEWPGAKKTPTP